MNGRFLFVNSRFLLLNRRFLFLNRLLYNQILLHVWLCRILLDGRLLHYCGAARFVRYGRGRLHCHGCSFFLHGIARCGSLYERLALLLILRFAILQVQECISRTVASVRTIEVVRAVFRHFHLVVLRLRCRYRLRNIEQLLVANLYRREVFVVEAGVIVVAELSSEQRQVLLAYYNSAVSAYQ